MTDCKACLQKDTVKEFINFGNMPLGNAFPRTLEDCQNEKRYPLKLGFCEWCKLVQQIEPPPLESIEDDYRNYSYVPFGETLRDHYLRLADSICCELKLKETSLVVDIGSNNGLLLSFIREISSCRILGVEPAILISDKARVNEIPTISSFFTHDIAKEIMMRCGHADVVILTQVLQHIPDINQFLDDICYLMLPNGTLVIEGRYFADTIKKVSYDSIYHEMMWFFTLHSLMKLLSGHQLTINHAETNSIYGGSLRIYANRRPSMDDSVRQLLQMEGDPGLFFSTYKQFSEKAFKLSEQFGLEVKRLKDRGKTIAAYGAPSTSATILNFAGLTNRHLEYVVDDSPLKVGCYTPGSHIPIVPFNTLLTSRPDYLIILAWRLADEILPKLKEVRKLGTKIILPLPRMEVV